MATGCQAPHATVQMPGFAEEAAHHDCYSTHVDAESVESQPSTIVTTFVDQYTDLSTQLDDGCNMNGQIIDSDLPEFRA